VKRFLAALLVAAYLSLPLTGQAKPPSIPSPLGFLPALIVYRGTSPIAFRVVGNPTKTVQDCLNSLAGPVQMIDLKGAPQGVSANGVCVPIPPAHLMPATKNPSNPLNPQSFQQEIHGNGVV